MAYRLAIYDDRQIIVAHTRECVTVGTSERRFQASSLVRVPPGWELVRCPKCQPDVFVVHVSTTRVSGGKKPPADGSRGPNGYTMKGWNRSINYRGQRDISFPPFGVTALDIGYSENRANWTELANCRSEDERLGEWLHWLYTAEHDKHWALTMMKVVCSECDVRAECLEQGVWGFEAWGVWGGATEKERRQIRRKWLREGRVDERPSRPRNIVVRNVKLQREDGSWVAVESGDDEAGTGEGAGHDEGEGETVYEVSSEVEVRWPRGYDGTGRTRGEWGSGGTGDW